MSQDNVLQLTRVFDAPPEAVFGLWSDPERIRDWWHPAGFETSRVEMDFREGGGWRFGFRREGRDICAAGRYEVIEPQRRIVMSFRWESGDGRDHPATRITIDFTPEPGSRTRLAFRQEAFTTVEARDAHVVGWTQVLDGFGQALTTEVQP